MSIPYHLDLSEFSLDEFRRTLETEKLLPSRRMLAEEIPQRFAVLAEMGICNLQDLTAALGSKLKLARFAEASGLPEAYLTLLRRQTLIYTPKPIALAKFPDIDPDHVERLAAMGIKQTKQLFEQGQDAAARRQLAERSGVPEDAIVELVKLADLARVGWVGPIYARLIYAAGAETLADLARQTPDEFYARVQSVYAVCEFTTAGFSVKDMAKTIELAKRLPKAHLEA